MAEVVENANVQELLKDPLILVATKEVVGGDRSVIDALALEKKNAKEELCKKYSNETFSNADVKLCLACIADNNSFLRANRDPVERMIEYLKSNFSPDTISERRLSLEIRNRRGGSKLSHDHKTQYYFCLQTLTLWSEIMNNFFKLWTLAENDLLDERNGYRLMNTGQGMQRCQSAPRVARAMSII